jgi:outer membrane biosynthesis protein TonB
VLELPPEADPPLPECPPEAEPPVLVAPPEAEPPLPEPPEPDPPLPEPPEPDPPLPVEPPEPLPPRPDAPPSPLPALGPEQAVRPKARVVARSAAAPKDVRAGTSQSVYADAAGRRENEPTASRVNVIRGICFGARFR